MPCILFPFTHMGDETQAYITFCPMVRTILPYQNVKTQIQKCPSRLSRYCKKKWKYSTGKQVLGCWWQLIEHVPSSILPNLSASRTGVFSRLYEVRLSPCP